MSRPVVVFADLEQDAADFFASWLAGRDEPVAAGVVVHIRTPEVRPSKLVTIRRAGGSGSYLLDVPRFAVTCWHDSDVQTADLCALVRAGFYAMRGWRGFRGVRSMTGPVPAPDTDGAPRYLLTAEITCKGATP